jgi:hypothetical protein
MVAVGAYRGRSAQVGRVPVQEDHVVDALHG